MEPVEFPQRHVASLLEAASRLFDSRKAGSDPKPLARELLLAFFDTCLRLGLDRVLVELARLHPPIDLADRTSLGDHETLFPALVDKLSIADLDGRGPRNVKPGLLVDALIAALGLSPVVEPDRTISLGDDIRAAVAVAMSEAITDELDIPKIRDTVIAEARTRVDEKFLGTFNKIAAQLDERGMQLLKQPKVPIDASQAVQLALFQARNAIVDRVGRVALDRARDVIARVDAGAAARIDEPISLTLTVRDVAIARACDPRVLKTPIIVTRSLVDSLAELARISWRVPEKAARPYAASQTFAVGDLIDHPKFGRGAVVSTLAQRIDVEFPDGVHTLAHVAPRPR